MVVMVMENVPPSLRGELTRWMLEAKAGVFVGVMSASVRERLWAKVTGNCVEGGAMLVYSADTEQGFDLKMHGVLRKGVVDLEGIKLIKTTE
jgi:CRISPR-associated protein Cas2